MASLRETGCMNVESLIVGDEAGNRSYGQHLRLLIQLTSKRCHFACSAAGKPTSMIGNKLCTTAIGK